MAKVKIGDRLLTVEERLVAEKYVLDTRLSSFPPMFICFQSCMSNTFKVLSYVGIFFCLCSFLFYFVSDCTLLILSFFSSFSFRSSKTSWGGGDGVDFVCLSCPFSFRNSLNQNEKRGEKKGEKKKKKRGGLISFLI